MSALQDLSKGYNNIGTKLIDNSGLVAARLFQQLGSWRDDDVKTYIEILTASLDGAKLQASQSTVSFYSQMAQLNGQDLAKPALVMSDLSTQKLRGVGSEIVYQRPFVDMRTQLSKGKTFKEAVDAGARRAASLASTEVQLARRNTGLQIRNENDRIVGYIRTLTGAESCALCNVASTQRYRRGDLMPIHPGCDCGEMPIFGNQDPGQVINDVRLDAIQENVESRFGIQDAGARAIDYRKIAIREHGELGPILAVAKNNTETVGEVGTLFGKSRIVGSLNGAQKSSVKSYASNASNEINGGLRFGWNPRENIMLRGLEPPQIERLKKSVENIQGAVSKTAIAEPTVVYRGTKMPDLVGKTKRELVGLEITEPGFSSTTKNTFQEFAENMSFATDNENVVLEFSLKKGDKGLDLVATELSGYKNEAEILLQKGTKFKITDVIDKGYAFKGQPSTMKVIQVEVITDDI